MLCAQQATQAPRVGFLLAESASGQAVRLDSLRSGLRDLGYADGKNVVIEVRSAEGHYERLPNLTAELLGLKVAVLVAFGAKAVAAAKDATTSVPIVVPSSGDPVASGFSTSFAAPSRNIVGSDNMGRDVNAKRLELLKEAIPGIRRVGVLINPANTTSSMVAVSTAAAKSLNVQIQVFEARTHKDLIDAFSTIAKSRNDAVLIQQDTLFISYAREIAGFAIKQRLPSSGMKEYAEAGGLFGYGASDAELYRRAAYFVDRLLKGTKPSALPFERATKFELVINLKTAKVLGMTIPQSVRLRADTVIE
jgi:putative ABC transport system substrate-binding protein